MAAHAAGQRAAGHAWQASTSSKKSSGDVPEQAPSPGPFSISPDSTDQSAALPSVFTNSQEPQQQQAHARKGSYSATDPVSPALTPRPPQPNSPRPPAAPPRKPPTVAGVLDMLKQRFSLPAPSVTRAHEVPAVAASSSSFSAQQQQQQPGAAAGELYVTRSSHSVPTLPALNSSKQPIRTTRASLEICVPPSGAFLTTGSSPTTHSGPPSGNGPCLPSSSSLSHSGPLPSVLSPQAPISPRPPRKGALGDARYRDRSKSSLLAVHASHAAKQQAVRRASLAVPPGAPGRDANSCPLIPALSSLSGPDVRTYAEVPDVARRTQGCSISSSGNAFAADGGLV